MRYPALLFPLLLLSSLAIGVPCDSSIGMLVPAVVGNGGGLVNVTMSLQDGDGSIYTTIDPRLGLMTQDSIDQAVGYARRLSEDDGACDVIVRFEPMEGAGYIDGPSAGSALTIMAYALFSNESIRSDTIITAG
jgi:predicted S18 family serine protease